MNPTARGREGRMRERERERERGGGFEIHCWGTMFFLSLYRGHFDPHRSLSISSCCKLGPYKADYSAAPRVHQGDIHIVPHLSH